MISRSILLAWANFCQIRDYISTNSDIFDHNLKTLAELENQELHRICRQLNIPNGQD